MEKPEQGPYSGPAPAVFYCFLGGRQIIKIYPTLAHSHVHMAGIWFRLRWQRSAGGGTSPMNLSVNENDFHCSVSLRPSVLIKIKVEITTLRMRT